MERLVGYWKQTRCVLMTVICMIGSPALAGPSGSETGNPRVTKSQILKTKSFRSFRLQRKTGEGDSPQWLYSDNKQHILSIRTGPKGAVAHAGIVWVGLQEAEQAGNARQGLNAFFRLGNALFTALTPNWPDRDRENFEDECFGAYQRTLTIGEATRGGMTMRIGRDGDMLAFTVEVL